MISGIVPGDIFIAADGNKWGHVVTDITTYSSVDDVVTIPFNAERMKLEEVGNRIDFFKLTQVRYYRPEPIPKWVPDSVLDYSRKIQSIE